MILNPLTALSSVPADKLGHFTAGVLIYAALHFISPTVGLLAVVVAAWGKEVYDYLHRNKHSPDPLDALATMIGGLIGFTCSL